VLDVSRISPVPSRRLCKFFEANGFKLLRQRGDHLILSKEGVKRPIVIPEKDEVPVFVILNNLRSAGISREKYLQMMDNI